MNERKGTRRRGYTHQRHVGAYVGSWAFNAARCGEADVEVDIDLADSLAALAIVGATGDLDSAKAPDEESCESRALAALRSMRASIDEALRILQSPDDNNED